jgi:1,4-dihydroxy-2-naphthoyl-CoA hydrolase
MVVLIFRGRNRLSLFRAPADFVQSGKRFVRNAESKKLLYGLFAPLERRGIHFVEGNILVLLEKKPGLRPSAIVEIRVNPATLHDVLQVEIRLPVSYQIDFFDAQFCCILALPLPEGNIFLQIVNPDGPSWRKNRKIVHSSINLRLTQYAMGIFKSGVTPESLNEFSKGTLGEHLGIRFTVIGEDYLEATMPVESRTHQPMGLLHGGASVALAETLGSVAATLCVDPSRQYCVGLEINANHLKGVRSGFVKGTTRPIHIGKKTHVWEIRIVNEQNEMVCVSRITMAVLDKKPQEEK